MKTKAIILLPLSKDLFTTMNFSDYGPVSDYKYHAAVQKSGVVYAARNFRLPNGRQATTFLHRDILGPIVALVDHKDGNGLNNRRDNLRPATRQQNLRGTRRPKTGMTSKFRGVFKVSGSPKWRARIGIDGKQRHLGVFNAEEAAARAYDAAAKQFFGEFATSNFPT